MDNLRKKWKRGRGKCQGVVYLLFRAWVGWCVLCVLGPSRGLGRVGRLEFGGFEVLRARLDAAR